MLAGAEITVDDKHCVTLPDSADAFTYAGEHWGKFHCEGDGVSGSTLKITAPAERKAIAMCGLKIYGIPSPEGQIEKLNKEQNDIRQGKWSAISVYETQALGLQGQIDEVEAEILSVTYANNGLLEADEEQWDGVDTDQLWKNDCYFQMWALHLLCINDDELSDMRSRFGGRRRDDGDGDGRFERDGSDENYGWMGKQWFPEDHDHSKCLENDMFDGDCCALASSGSCGDGYVYSQGVTCYRGRGWEAVTTFCQPGDTDGGWQGHLYFHDDHHFDQCTENGAADTDCCAVPANAGCADPDYTYSSGYMCYEAEDEADNEYSTFCRKFPPTHDASKCRENRVVDEDIPGTYTDESTWEVQFDEDCCALKEHASCADGYALTHGDVCWHGGWWDAYSTFCTPN